MELHAEELSFLLGQYPIVVKHVSKMGPNRYRIDGPFDLYELSILNQASGLVRAFVSDYAALRGFWRSQRFIRSVYGDSIIDVGNGNVACLQDWFSGTLCRPEEPDLTSVAHTLACLHNALYGANAAISNTQLAMVTQKSLPGWFSRRMNELDRTLLNHCQPIFHKWFEEAEMRANWLLPILQDYTVREGRSICWNITAFHDFIQFQNGRVGVLQTSDPEVSTDLLDLSVLVFEACTNGGVENVQIVLNAYQKIVSLGKTDINFVLACSAFPRAVPDYFQQGILLADTEEKHESVLRLFAEEAQIAHKLMRMIRFS